MNPYISVILGTICISFAAIFVKWADVDPTVSAVYRTFYGSLSLIAILALLRLRKKQTLLFSKKILWMCALPGIILAADLFFWHQSIPIIGAGLSTLVANTQIFYAVLIGYFFLGERLTWHWWIILPVAFTGIILVGLKNIDLTIDWYFFTGIGYACLAGILYVFFLMYNKKVREAYTQTSPIYTWMLVSSFSCLGLVLLSTIESPNYEISLEAHGILFSLGFVAQAVGWIFITYGIQRIPLIHTSFILLGQPALTTLWGYLFFDERLTVLQSIGVVLVFGMIGTGQFIMHTTPKDDV